MKRFLSTLLALILVFSMIPGQTLAEVLAVTELDQQIDLIFRRSKTIGASLIIIKDGQVVYTRDYGRRNISRNLPVDENTYFKMGCVTKMVASLGILQLVEDGTLDLDEDISTYFGYPIANPYYPKIPLTLRQLLSHTSTVSEKGGYNNLNSTVEQMLAAKYKRKNNYTKFQPGSKYAYSNFGSGLVGSIVESVTGQTINSFIVDRVFKPLSIDASMVGSELLSPEDLASVYQNGQLSRSAQRYINELPQKAANPETNYRDMVGGLLIRSRDLAKLTIALCGDGSVDGVRYLQPETVELMRQVQMDLGKSVIGPSPYGLFLERNTRVMPGVTIFGHQGMTGGASNNVFFDPETQFIMVVTTNGCSQVRDHGTIVLAQNLLRYTYPIFSGRISNE